MVLNSPTVKMKILLYHFGYYGDIIVVGQNFARELKIRFPKSKISLMVRPRVDKIIDIIEPLELFSDIIHGEKSDFQALRRNYDQSYIIDEFVYPEGNLRTIFTKSGFPFRQHRLLLKFKDSDLSVAKKIVKGKKTPIISTQDDMSRKWKESKVVDFHNRVKQISELIVLGPNIINEQIGRELSFLESCAVAHLSDIFVGIDSGIAHGAALSGTQTILIPPLIPESYISPTEYANQFIEDDHMKHISIRPNQDDFCGNYKCLKGTNDNAVKQPLGNPLKVKCNWNKKYFFLSKPSCFTKITVDSFFKQVLVTLRNRDLI